MIKLGTVRSYFFMLLVLMAAGCGGSDKSSSPMISGIAAAGSALTGTVYLKDSSAPVRELSVPIAADGSFSLNSNGLTAPFILKAVGTANGKNLTLYSFGSSAGIININTLSNLAVVLANGGDLDSLFRSPGTERMHLVMNALPGAIAKVQTALQPTLAKFKAATANFITAPFIANHQGLDLFMDMAVISVDDNYVTIVDMTTIRSITMTLAEFTNRSIDIVSDPQTRLGTVSISPTPVVVAPQATLNFAAVVIGLYNQQVIWKVVEDNGGTITNTGAYTAPATAGTFHVTATSVADATSAATVEVTVSSKNILELVSSGPGVYTIQAKNFDGVAGIEFKMAYDTAVLGNPSVTWGPLVSGFMSALNIGVPGSVRGVFVSATSPIIGSGTVATISFGLLNASSGGIRSFSANLIDLRGKTVGTVELNAPSFP